MRRKILSLALVFLSVIGILDAGYITYEKMSGRIPPCNPTFKCEAVLNSPWASIGPIPLSVFGLFFYATFLGLAACQVCEISQLKVGQIHIPIEKVLLGWGIVGVVFSMILIFLMGVVIQAWCFYCLVSAANCLLLGTLCVFNVYLSLTKSLLVYHERFV